jgi:hypothetical protein
MNEDKIIETFHYLAQEDVDRALRNALSQAREAGYQSALEEALGCVPKEERPHSWSSVEGILRSNGVNLCRAQTIEAIKKLMTL